MPIGTGERSVLDHPPLGGLTQKRRLCYRKGYPNWGSVVPLYMDKLLNDLGEIVLNALPTTLIVLLLAVFVKYLYLKPLEATLAERHRLSEGARLAAEQGLHSADAKIAAYEAALDKARAEVYGQQAEFLKKLHAEQAERAKAAKSTSDVTLAAVKESLAAEAAAARGQLSAQSEQLASEIANSILAGRRPVV